MTPAHWTVLLLAAILFLLVFVALSDAATF